MFWCYICEKSVSATNLKCNECGSEAIEQIQSSQNPQHFAPFNVQEEQPSQANSQNQPEFDPMDPFGMIGGLPGFLHGPMMQMMAPVQIVEHLVMTPQGPMIVRQRVQRPPMRFIIIEGGQQEQIKKPVPEETIKKLDKIDLHEECAICQEAEGQGLRLPCKHEFHEHCIKPWFSDKNTCPCCRAELAE